MNGPDFAVKLTRERPGIRILLMSGYADTSPPGGDVLPGAEYLPKPITPSVLLAKVRSILDAEPRTR